MMMRASARHFQAVNARGRHPRPVWWLAPAALLLASCSLVLDWEGAAEEQACDAANHDACLPGYSCLGELCVADGSVERHGTCMRSEQCDGYPDMICGQGHTCRMGCDTEYLYTAPAVCLGGEFCHPEKEQGDREWTGTCLQSECDEHIDCEAENKGDTCVQISAMAKACEAGCEILWDDGVYGDTCTDGAAKFNCQPIGMKGVEQLVCLERVIAGRNVNEGCHPLDAPCKDDLVCVQRIQGDDGTCRAYCNPDDPVQCGAEEICCPNTRDVTAEVLYSYCARTEACNY